MDPQASKYRAAVAGIVAAAIALAALPSAAHAALSFTVEASGWPDQARRDAAVAALQSAVNRYNAYGNFGNYNVYAYYNAGIPTAQASYLGSIGFGGTYPNERVTMHEMSHYLGTGTYGTPWDGVRGEALIDQFDGLEASLNGDSAHYWPYGLNYDSEGSEINKQRHVALLYAMRADMGIGSTANPWSATVVNLTASDPFGESGFNYKSRWSDGYFAHAGAAYHAGAYILRTPESSNSFTFAGDSLTLSNPSVDTGLYFKGVGTSGIVKFNNLILDGGWIDHRSSNNLADLFQLAGKVTVNAPSTIRAFNGNINILADVTGNGDINIPLSSNPTENNRYVRFLSSNNSFVGSINNGSRFELGNSANFRFKIGTAGVNNAIAGASARNTLLNGTFEFDLTGASANVGDSWAVVTAANTTYGASFNVAGFANRAGVWRGGSYAFHPATGLLTVIPTYAWNVDGGGPWSIAANWTYGAPPANEDAILGSVLTAPNAPATINVDLSPTLNRLKFDNANRYVLSGAGAITLTGDAEIVATAGDHTVGVTIAGSAGLNVPGPGKVTLSAANTYSGVTNIRGGTLALSGAGSIAGSAAINVFPGATLNVSGLDGGLQLASGQTLTNNSDNTLAGTVVATFGATVTGTGTFAGNLTAQAGSVVRVGASGLSAVAPVVGQVTYLDATAGSGGNTTRTDGAVFSPQPQGTTGADNNWELRTLGNNATVMEAGGEIAEDAYEIKTTITGLVPYENYSVRAFFWDPTSTAEDWNIRAGFASNPGGNTLYSAADSTAELGGATAAPLASSLTFSSAPLTSESGRALLAASLGTRRADENGRIEVFLDDLPSAIGANRRTWYDGLGVSPLGPVTMNVDGNYTQEDGATLVMDILNPSNHDKLIVGGTLAVGGTLQVLQSAGAATLAAGNAFDLFDFAAATGAFTSFNLPALAAGLRWDTSSLYTTGMLLVAASVAGDYNNDGTVDAADYVVWRESVGSATIPNRGTGITGPVGQADYDFWRSRFGATGGAAAGTAESAGPVPEPATAALFALAALLASPRRFKRLRRAQAAPLGR